MLGISTDEKTVENEYQVTEFVLESRRTTIHGTADIVGISFWSVHSIMKDNVNMCPTATDFVLRHLGVEQKENRIDTCQDFRQRS